MYQATSPAPLQGMTPIAHPAPRNPNAVAIVAALSILAGAIITLVTVFQLVQWDGAQTALVTAEVAAVTGLLTAIVRHVKRGTKKEHVALAATFTASVAATLALGTGFGWWSMDDKETAALIGVLTALIGVGTAMFAREHVVAEETPTT
jgi:hypothetical protein